MAYYYPTVRTDGGHNSIYQRDEEKMSDSILCSVLIEFNKVNNISLLFTLLKDRFIDHSLRTCKFNHG